MACVLSTSKAVFLVLLFFTLHVSPANSNKLSDDVLFIQFSAAIAPLYTLKFESERYFYDRGELLTSPDQLRIKIDAIYNSHAAFSNSGSIEALERIVIEDDGRLKVYLNKNFGEAAYYGYSPKFVYKKYVDWGVNETRKYLEWDCITNLPARITKNMSGCSKDAPVKHDVVVAAVQQDEIDASKLVMRVMKKAEIIRNQMEAHRKAHSNEWPSNIYFAGYQPWQRSEQDITEDVAIERNGKLIIRLHNSFGHGKFMAFTPDVGAVKFVDWRCTTNLAQSIVKKSGYVCGVE